MKWSVALALTVGGLLWGLATTWQLHLDTSRRQCERLADHLTILERILYSEHPEYSSWISTQDKCQ